MLVFTHKCKDKGVVLGIFSCNFPEEKLFHLYYCCAPQKQKACNL